MNRNLPILDTEFFRGSDAVACAVLTQHQLRAGPYRRLFHGIYAAPGVEITHELKCRAIALCSPLATITGRSAATVHGVPLARAGDEVEIVVPKDHPVHRIRGVSMRSVRMRPGAMCGWRPRCGRHSTW